MGCYTNMPVTSNLCQLCLTLGEKSFILYYFVIEILWHSKCIFEGMSIENTYSGQGGPTVGTTALVLKDPFLETYVYVILLA